MATDTGLLGGLGQGIQQGLLAYQRQKQLNRDNQIQNLTSGLEEDENGNMRAGAGLIAKQQSQQAQQQGLIRQENLAQEGDKADSVASQGTRNMARLGLKKALNLSDQQVNQAIPDTATHNQLMADNGYAKALITGGFGVQGNQAKAGGMNGRTNELMNKNAGAVGQEYEHDPILKSSKTSLNSLTRSSSILDDPNKPVTTKDLNLAFTDYINSVANGGAATEGKIHRELPETFETTWNELKQKVGQNDDLRKTKGGQALIDMLKENIHTVRHDLSGAMADQAYNIHTNYTTSTNPRVQQTNKDKLKLYAPDKYQELYGAPGQKAQASPVATAPTPTGLMGGATAPQAAAPQQQDYPVGTVAKTKAGVPVVYEGNGKWQPQ